MEVISAKRMTWSSTHEINHGHITWLEQIDHLLVLSSGHLLCPGVRSQHLLQIRPERKVLCSNCAADKLLPRMKHLKLRAGKLMFVTLVPQVSPGLLNRQALHP